MIILVDPCMFSNGGCSGGAICTSENFVVTCSCERPYNLNDDKVSCTMDRTEACKMNNQRYDTKLDRCVGKCSKCLNIDTMRTLGL